MFAYVNIDAGKIAFKLYNAPEVSGVGEPVSTDITVIDIRREFADKLGFTFHDVSVFAVDDSDKDLADGHVVPRAVECIMYYGDVECEIPDVWASSTGGTYSKLHVTIDTAVLRGENAVMVSGIAFDLTSLVVTDAGSFRLLSAVAERMEAELSHYTSVSRRNNVIGLGCPIAYLNAYRNIKNVSRDQDEYFNLYSDNDILTVLFDGIAYISCGDIPVPRVRGSRGGVFGNICIKDVQHDCVIYRRDGVEVMAIYGYECGDPAFKYQAMSPAGAIQLADMLDEPMLTSTIGTCPSIRNEFGYLNACFSDNRMRGGFGSRDRYDDRDEDRRGRRRAMDEDRRERDEDRRGRRSTFGNERDDDRRERRSVREHFGFERNSASRTRILDELVSTAENKE